MKFFSCLISSLLLFASVSFAAPYDVISSNTGFRSGHFDVTGSRCWLRIWKNPQFNVTSPPYDAVEFFVQFVRPANQLIATGIQPPGNDMVTKLDPQTLSANWNLNSANGVVEYRGVVSAQKVEADFYIDPLSEKISRIFLRKVGERKSVDSICELK